MIGYHYSPIENGESIARHGLLVPTRHPKLTAPMVCSEGHRNPHISLGKSPQAAWELSGGFLLRRMMEDKGHLEDPPYFTYFNAPEHWYLYQVWLERKKYWSNGFELQSRRDIPRRHVVRVGSRAIRE
jgi:hypothetical protein